MGLVNLETDHKSLVDMLFSTAKARGLASSEDEYLRVADELNRRSAQKIREGEQTREDFVIGENVSQSLETVREPKTDQSDLSDRGEAQVAPRYDEEQTPDARSDVVSSAPADGDPSVVTKTDATREPRIQQNTLPSASSAGDHPTKTPQAAAIHQAVSVDVDTIETTEPGKFAGLLKTGITAADTGSEATRTQFQTAPDAELLEVLMREPRKLDELQDRLPALEILARRHGEAVARLMAGALNVRDDLPTDVDVRSSVSIDLNQWRKSHMRADSPKQAANETKPGPLAPPADADRLGSLANVVPLRSMGARESVISAGATKSSGASSTLPTVVNVESGARAGASTTSTGTIASPQNVDMSSRIEKFQAIVSRVAHSIVRTAEAGGGSAVVRLHPAHLGRIRIEVSVEHQVAAVQLVVENPQVRQAMSMDGWLLRETLAQQGITLGDFNVRGDDAGATYFGSKDANASPERSETRGRNRSPLEPVASETAPVPRRDLRPSRISVTI